MAKKRITPNTTLYPAPVVLVSTGTDPVNVMTCNRISSCSAEPPRLAISIRPGRYTHNLILENGEFVVSLPEPTQLTLTDYLGVVSGKEEDKIAAAGLRLEPAHAVKTLLLADFPVNIECTLENTLDLDSHTLFIGRVLAVHVEEALLAENGEILVEKAQGITYAAGAVREKPTYKFNVDELRRKILDSKR